MIATRGVWILAGVLAVAGTAFGASRKPGGPHLEAQYRQAIDKTVGMVGNAQAQQLAGKHGLQVLNLTWEDTGRSKNSALGPNISDMTIQVQLKN